MLLKVRLLKLVALCSPHHPVSPPSSSPGLLGEVPRALTDEAQQPTLSEASTAAKGAPNVGPGLLGAAPSAVPPGGAKEHGLTAAEKSDGSLLGSPEKALLKTPPQGLLGNQDLTPNKPPFRARGESSARGSYPPRGRGGPSPRGGMGMGMKQPHRGGFTPRDGGMGFRGSPRGFPPHRGGHDTTGIRSLFDSPVQRPRGLGHMGNMRGGPTKGFHHAFSSTAMQCVGSAWNPVKACGLQC